MLTDLPPPVRRWHALVESCDPAGLDEFLADDAVFHPRCPCSAVLELTAEVEGREVHGVDLLRWDATGSVIELTVMVRPLRGLEALVSLMGEKLTA